MNIQSHRNANRGMQAIAKQHNSSRKQTAHVRVCVYYFVYACMYVCLFVGMYVYMHACMCMYMYVCIHIYIYIYTYICIYIYIYIYISNATRSPVPGAGRRSHAALAGGPRGCFALGRDPEGAEGKRRGFKAQTYRLKEELEEVSMRLLGDSRRLGFSGSGA